MIHADSRESAGGFALRRMRVTHDLNRGLRFAGLKWQMFSLWIENVSSTIKHYFYYSEQGSGQIDRINTSNAPLGNLVATPTVSNVVDFGGVGAGFLSGTVNRILLDTPIEQDPSQLIMIAGINLYDGNSTIPRASCGISADNVNGVTKNRPSITLYNDMTGAAIPAWTTFIPSTRRIRINVMAFFK